MSHHTFNISAYTDKTSYVGGDAVEVHAGAASATIATWELWRLGYYGGTGGRKVLEGGPVAVPVWTPAILDPATGAVSAAWPATFQVRLLPDAVTGIFVIKLISEALGETYAFLVVRERVPGAPILYPVSTNTYQAYNSWGGTSLYVNSRADWKPWHAFAVSFDRPYDHGSGTGEFLSKDRDFLTFAEGQGYDIAYVIDTDLDAEPALVAYRHMILFQGHTEYWTLGMRDAVEGAIAQGTNAGFLGANDAYWQTRFAGAERRLMIGYKQFAALDPILATAPRLITTQWRDPRIGRPENAMIGEMLGDWIWTTAPLSVADPSSWVWTGSGVDSTSTIPGVYGVEVDHRVENGAQPAGVGVLGDALVEGHGARFSHAETTLYTAPSGARVFSSGSISWSDALSGVGTWDPRIQQLIANLFSSFAGDGVLGAAALKPLLLPAGLAQPDFVPGVAVATVTTALSQPAAVAAAPDGDAIVADGDRILRVTPAGLVSVVAGSTAGAADGPTSQATFSGPRGLAVAANGDIFVSDTGNNRIRVISAGRVRTLAGGARGFADAAGILGAQDASARGAARFSLPMGIALTDAGVDAQGRRVGTLLVADAWNQRLRAVDPAGNVTTWAGTGVNSAVDGPGATASLSFPFAVAVLPSGDAVIAEPGTGVVRRVAAAATHFVSTLAGAQGRGGFGDGPLRAASVSETLALAATPDGQVILVDGASARVRTIRSGAVATLAGGLHGGTIDGPGATAGFGCPRAAAAAPGGGIFIVDAREHALRRLQLPP
jgi:NHL repeat